MAQFGFRVLKLGFTLFYVLFIKQILRKAQDDRRMRQLYALRQVQGALASSGSAAPLVVSLAAEPVEAVTHARIGR